MEYSFDKFVDNREIYFDYLKTIKNSLSPNLYKIYMEEYSNIPHNRFHDSLISKITVLGDSQLYKGGYDSIEMELMLGGRLEYRLKFSHVAKFICNFENNDQEIPFLKHAICGEILTCILGVSETGNQIMEFITSTESHCYIEFQKVRVQKLKII